MTDECAHDDLGFEVRVDQVLDEAGEQFLCALVRCKCLRCEELFSWRGVGSGYPSAAEPFTSADGFELRAPIAPGPGGVVGVLKIAGLQDMLGPEGPREEARA